MAFRAAVLAAPGEKLTIESVEIDRVPPDSVLVRMGAAGICHTDLEVIEGQLAYPMPITLGHEGAGTIAEVGDGVDPARIGEKVVLSWNPHCGTCPACERGEAILCARYLALGPQAVDFTGQTRLRCATGAVHTMFFMAAFAEYAVVTAGCAVTIPAEMPLDRACLLGCGVMTGHGAVTNVSGIRPGDSAMVIGCGAVGLAAVQAARLAGASTVIAVDRHDPKLDLALEYGATHVINSRRHDALALARRLTGGTGVDCVVESAGSLSAFRLSTEACRPGGEIIWLGKLGVDEDVTFRWGALMQEKRIRRNSYGNARPSRDFPALCRQYLDGRLKLDTLVTGRIPLERINEGFDLLRQRQAIRTVVVFE
ncbi:zinc-binding dehydrogenase [Prauserella oleivorans]|uniref:Zinc-binding dehydrogenase n=1 Tax=Prauserella oleivorans TaxID=1478153 RepID=A0ABW5W5G9_9PSEU